MKIDPNMTIGSVAGATIKPSSGARGAFEDVLQGMETDTVRKPAAVHAQYRPDAISPQKLNAVGTSEEALVLLERYSRAVADPALNLKDVAPLVDELEAMKTKVDGAASFISDDDPLKGIMNEVSTALYGEVVRFRRGDLVA